MKEIYCKVPEFITYCKLTKNLSPKTIIAYGQDLKTFINFFDGSSNLNVMQYVSYLMETNHKSSTIKRQLATIKQYFKYLYKNNRLANPMLEFDFKLKPEKVLPRTISIHEVKKLFALLDRQKTTTHSPFQLFQLTRDKALIDLLCSTGIRIGEAAAITLSDLDFRSRIILIHGKGKKERLIYLSCEQTIANLKEWLSLRKSLHLDHSYVFVNRTLSPISIHAIEDIFSKYKRLAKINPNATPHYLRHTCATNLLANGADLRSVQEILGHSNIAITERYTEVTTNRKIKVLKKYNYRNSI